MDGRQIIELTKSNPNVALFIDKLGNATLATKPSERVRYSIEYCDRFDTFRAVDHHAAEYASRTDGSYCSACNGTEHQAMSWLAARILWGL